MPKPTLRPPFDQLAADMLETFLAGHHAWRPDLSYPQSHSDVYGGIHALLRMFEVKRRPIALNDDEIQEER